MMKELWNVKILHSYLFAVPCNILIQCALSATVTHLSTLTISNCKLFASQLSL